MSAGVHKTPSDDTFIPEPMFFARKLEWTHGWSKAWTWARLSDVAGELYWANRPSPAVRDVAA